MSKAFIAAPTLLGASCVAALCVGVTGAHAADPYPQRPVRVVVQFSPGGNVDTAARVISRQLALQMNQQFVIDNRSGASGSIAYQMLATAAPDGYTLGIGHIGHLALNPHTLGKVPYDPLKDFTAIGRMADAPNLLVANPGLPVKTVQDLVVYAKAHPGKVASGTGGVGTVGHLAVELLGQRAGILLLHVPYKGSSQVVTDLISGGVQISFGGPPSLLPHVKSGKLRALAITSLKRSPSIDLPTVAESGYPGFEAVAWMGLIAPAGLRKDLVERLNRELRESLKADEVRRILDANGFEIVGSTPLEFDRFIRAEYANWGKFVRERGIRGE